MKRRVKNPIKVDRCGPTRKVRFGSHQAAMERIDEICHEDITARLRPYLCIYCSGYHLTSQPREE